MGHLHLDFYSVWPVFACTALLLALAATPAFRAADSPPADQPRRIKTLDGLRGFLAIAVFFHHVALLHAESLTKVWRLTPSAFFNSLGPTGVAFFFMITGFLFWSRLIRSAERPAWPSFYLNRIFRIGPLFLFAAGLAMLAAAYKAGFPHGMQALQRLGSWLFLGVLPFQDGGWLVGVTWSIQYEWFFYLSLPLLAVFARRRVHLPFVLTALALCTLGEILCSNGGLIRADPATLPGLALPLTYVTLFLLGMLSATLTRLNVLGRLPDWLASLAVVLCAVTFLVLKDPAKLPKQILLGATFYLIASGCTLFGLFTSRPAIRLGDISYGIYLLQGLVLSVVFRPRIMRFIALASPWHHWALTLLSMVLLVVLATLAHVLIERPGIRLGRRITAALDARHGILPRATSVTPAD